MKEMNSKYNKTIGILRKSKPELDSTNDIGHEVVRRISSLSVANKYKFSIIALLFGWTDIVWIRRSLITVSVILVSLFIYQQSVIVKQLNRLTGQIVINKESQVLSSRPDYERRLKLLKFSGKTIQLHRNNISQEEVDIIIESLNSLQSDYDNLIKIIEDDPELKKLIEKKLDEMNCKKTKL